MNSSELQSLIESDQEAGNLFATGNDRACAVRCSAIAPKVSRAVPALELKRQASLTGVWARIVIARENPETPVEVKGVLITFLDWIKDGNALDFSLPAVQQMAGGLVQAGLLSSDELDGILTLAESYPVITESMVEQLRTNT